MVHSNRRLQHRMKSVCRLPACLAWPHGLFGSWLFCICALLGFFEFLYHLSLLVVPRLWMPTGCSHWKSNHIQNQRIQIAEVRSQYQATFGEKVFLTFARKLGERNSSASGKQPRREARRENSASSGLEGMRIHSGVSFGSSLVGLHKIYSSLKCRI